MTQLYFADLLGGAIACVALVPLLNSLGAPNRILSAAVAILLASAFWATRRAVFPATPTAALLVLIAANYRGRIFEVMPEERWQ